MANEAKLAWLEVDANGLPKNLKALYGELKAAQKLVKEKKAEFESGMISLGLEREHITPQQTIMFSYRFGKLSMAITEKAEGSEPKPAKNAFRF